MCETLAALVSVMTWASTVNVPWFVAGTGAGVPAGIAIGSSLSNNVQGLTLVTTAAGFLGGVTADLISAKVSSHLEHSFTAYDVFTRGVGPACLVLVVLSRGLRTEPSVAVKPVAALALIALLLEPLFSAYVFSSAVGANNVAATAGPPAITVAARAFRGLARRILARGDQRVRRRSSPAASAAVAAASAVSRVRWLTAGVQVALWAAVVVAYARLSLRRLSGLSANRPNVRSYLTALGILASKKRGSGGWVRLGKGGTALGCTPWGGGGVVAGKFSMGGNQSRARMSSLLGSLYERFARRGPGGEANVFDSSGGAHSGPPFERGEVTIRGIRCAGLDAAITGRPASVVDPNAGVVVDSEGGGGADRGGGLAGRKSRPFYVTATLGSVTARTSVRPGFAPSFTEVFPFGTDCPIKGAFLVIAVVDSFETGLSGRGDRIIGEVHLPLEAAQLIPPVAGPPVAYDDPPTYRISGDWELQGVLGAVGGGATVGADVVVRGPPSPTSAAGKLRRRRESVGWYAR